MHSIYYGLQKPLVLLLLMPVMLLSGCDSNSSQQAELLQMEAENNQLEEEQFIAANRNKPGVQETASGLQYRIIKEGAGASPTAANKVRVHYRGRLLNDTEFDSSYSRGKPAEFPVNRLIPGWTEALQLMKPGSHWEVYIPAKLAYGARSPSKQIPPHSMLIFEMELISVLP